MEIMPPHRAGSRPRIQKVAGPTTQTQVSQYYCFRSTWKTGHTVGNTLKFLIARLFCKIYSDKEDTMGCSCRLGGGRVFAIISSWREQRRGVRASIELGSHARPNNWKALLRRPRTKNNAVDPPKGREEAGRHDKSCPC